MSDFHKSAFIVLALFSLGLCGPTPVRGVIEKDTEWELEKSPYIITGDILVKSSAVLRIESGVRVIVAKRDSSRGDSGIQQLDGSDSLLVAIKVEGGILCVGDADKWIVFAPEQSLGRGTAEWYGLVLDGVNEEYTELGFCEISGAVSGLRIRKCAPDLHNNIISYNTTGVFCDRGALPALHNNTIVHNTVAGVYNRAGNPQIHNNIIAFNRNHGIWSDGASQIEVGHNCLFGNRDGNFVDCPPQLGLIVRRNAEGDSCDRNYNIFTDPIFAGSVSDSAAEAKDLRRPTPGTQVKDTAIAQMAKRDRAGNEAARADRYKAGRYVLSNYSPCIDAGQSGKKFNDLDGSPNDMGAHGGPGAKLQ